MAAVSKKPTPAMAKTMPKNATQTAKKSAATPPSKPAPANAKSSKSELPNKLPRQIIDPTPTKPSSKPRKLKIANLSDEKTVAPAQAPAPQKVGTGKSVGNAAKVALKLPTNVQEIFEGIGLAPNSDAFQLLVTPDLANHFLKLNVSNRHLALPQCRRHAEAMVSKRWLNDGNPLKFNTEGKFMDGQHRLTGVVMANVPVMFDVRLNLPPETQATMDTGRRRSVADQLTINGEPYAKALAGTIGWIYRLCFDDMSYRIETPETLDFLDRNPKVRESVAFVHGGTETIKGTVATLLTAVHFIASTVLGEKSKADRFVEVFRSGYPAYQGDPAHRLRETNMRLMNQRQLRTDKASADILIYVWNLFREEKSARTLDVKGSHKIEGFKPEMVGISIERDYDVEKTTLPMGQTIERRIAE